MTKRIIDALGQSLPVRKIDMHDIGHRAGIHPAQFRVSFHLHVLQKFPDRRIRESFGLKLFLRHFPIDQRDRGDVGQTVVRRFTRLRFPFLRFAPNDVDRRVVAFDRHSFYLRKIDNRLAQK